MSPNVLSVAGPPVSLPVAVARRLALLFSLPLVRFPRPFSAPGFLCVTLGPSTSVVSYRPAEQIEAAADLLQGSARKSHEALTSRDVIGQAKGILMERLHVTPEEVFDLLRRPSQHFNMKLREVADGLHRLAISTQRTESSLRSPATIQKAARLGSVQSVVPRRLCPGPATPVPAENRAYDVS